MYMAVMSHKPAANGLSLRCNCQLPAKFICELMAYIVIVAHLALYY